MDKRAPELRRVMGFADLVLFCVITNFNVIWFVRAAEAGPAGITFWCISGIVFFLPLAVSVLVLTARFPGEGGLYVWSQQTFGDFAGFITGWSYWFCNLPFLTVVLYFIAGTALSLGGDRWVHLADDPAYFMTMSLACLAVATILNVVGLDVGKWLHNIGAFGTWLPALGMIILAAIAWANHGSVTELTAASFIPDAGFKNAVLWSVLVMSLTGLEAASIMGDEIQDLRRRIGPALIVAAVLVIVTNIVATLAVVVSIPSGQLNGSLGFMEAYKMAATRAGVSGFLPVVALMVIVGQLGKVGAWSATGARLPFVGGVAHCLPAVFARVHPRWHTPYVALLFQAAIVAALIVMGQWGTTTKGAFDVFQSMTLIPTFIPFLFLFAAVIRVQNGAPGPGRAARPAHRWLICTLAISGLATTVAAMALSIFPAPDEPNVPLYVTKVVGLAVLTLAVGVGAYWSGKRAAS